MTKYEMVREFLRKFGLEYEGKPRQLPPEITSVRLDHLYEEVDEYKKALREGNIEEQFDALIDIVYIALGNAYLQGFDFDEGFDRVHKANMKKERATKEKMTKRGSTFDVVKPPNWQKADLKSLL